MPLQRAADPDPALLQNGKLLRIAVPCGHGLSLLQQICADGVAGLAHAQYSKFQTLALLFRNLFQIVQRNRRLDIQMLCGVDGKILRMAALLTP